MFSLLQGILFSHSDTLKIIRFTLTTELWNGQEGPRRHHYRGKPASYKEL